MVCKKLEKMLVDEAEGMLKYVEIIDRMPEEHIKHIHVLEEYLEDQLKHFYGIKKVMEEMGCPIPKSTEEELIQTVGHVEDEKAEIEHKIERM